MQSPDGRTDELARLDDQERALSARRRRLHDRIDFLRGSGDDPGRLDQLLTEERDLSTERRALHERIDLLRVDLGLEPGPPPRPRLRD